MKNISLIKVTVAVAIATFASSLVSAKDIMPNIASELTSPAIQDIQFEQLDLDKDNLLSLVETEKYTSLHDAFTKIDINSDASISKDEFVTYITK